jgi:hypothetical protein
MIQYKHASIAAYEGADLGIAHVPRAEYAAYIASWLQ